MSNGICITRNGRLSGNSEENATWRGEVANLPPIVGIVSLHPSRTTPPDTSDVISLTSFCLDMYKDWSYTPLRSKGSILGVVLEPGLVQRLELHIMGCSSRVVHVHGLNNASRGRRTTLA
ncbi:hypothetical protein J6590_072821 [Homalodisca vitripennis]|nr:hypothetical protein J6590_072821 [Homalodisca vitripennis]